MKIFNRKMLLGLALLGATVSAPSAFADRKDRKEVRKAEKEVRKDRRDVRRADTPEERREAREELRDSREEYREERREYRRETGRPAPRNNNNGRYGNGNNGRYGYGNNNSNYGYNQGRYNQGRNNNYGQNNQQTLVGRVVQDTNGNDFSLRLTNGQVIRVVAVNGESGRISRGDQVQVSGTRNGANFRARTVRILRNR